jgi:hypothetical protein
MKNLLRIAAVATITLLGSTSHAQNRSVGTNKLVLDDGLGHTITLQIPTPSVTGTLTLPSATSTLANTAAGTVAGQTLRWNNATSQWEISPSITNVGSTLSNAGAITATGTSGNITASGSVTAGTNISTTGGNISTTGGNVTASGRLQAGTALGSASSANGGVYIDNMIMAAGYAGLTGALVSQVGNYTITKGVTGAYTITFPYGVSQYPIVLMSAGLNPISNFITSLNPLTIQVTEFFPGATVPVDGGFNFIVVGPHN